MKRKRICVALIVALTLTQGLFAETINMMKVGGKNDGKTSNTTVIAKMIDQLSAQGGGTLYFPAGTYLTGPITLKSNITLDLESGAVLSFSDNFDDYLPFVEMRFEGVVMKSFHPLISAYNAENITIKGRGLLNGNGQAWWNAAWGFDKKDPVNEKNMTKYQMMWDESNKDLKLEEGSDWKGTLSKRFFRPPFFQAYRSKNILIEGVKFTNSPFWTINPEFCSNIRVTGVTIDNPQSPNTDGINPSSCDNVHISDCHISVGDDCITIKSGRDLQGRKYATPCQNITITNCTMLAGHGGVVIGSEMSGDVRKVVISNCVFDGTDRGIRIKSTRGRGGIVEDIRVSNIVMKNILKEAITLNLFYSNVPAEPVSERTPIFRNIHISTMTGVQVNAAGTILGIPEMPISGISLTDIDLQTKIGFVVNDATDITMNAVTVDTESGSAFKLNRVSEVHMTDVRTRKPLQTEPVISLTDCQDFFIQNCFPMAGSAAFVAVDGSQTKGIILMNNYLKRLTNPVKKAGNVASDAVVLQ
jgi:polygalacturonase